jgi:iron-siderophore transport system permease protein
VASLAIGTENVTLTTVWAAVTDNRDIGDQWIVHELRIPRTALALLVGLGLGLSGTLIQAVGRNPLADSEILGINSGAALFVVFAIAFLGMTGIWTYIWFAGAGASGSPSDCATRGHSTTCGSGTPARSTAAPSTSRPPSPPS